MNSGAASHGGIAGEDHICRIADEEVSISRNLGLVGPISAQEQCPIIGNVAFEAQAISCERAGFDEGASCVGVIAGEGEGAFAELYKGEGA